jgi:starch-binding outer membrane protein, SusD/RagB family
MHQMRNVIAAALLVATVASCKQSDLNITNPNNATVAGALADPTAFQLLATGIQVDFRSTGTCRIGGGTIGMIGRESYSFSPQEGRPVQNSLIGVVINGVKKLDSGGFATGCWSGPYNTLRDLYNFRNTIAGSTTLTAAGKAAALGYAQTIEAASLMEIVATKDTLGGITEIKANATELAPFVTRDSMYKYILNTFDAGATNLAAGGAAFPFTLTPGYNGFSTPTTFAQFNRAMKARAAAWYATSGGGAAAWAQVLAALQASFLNPTATTRAALDVGVYATFGVAPDTPNGAAASTNTTTYMHMSFQTDAQLQADGKTLDNRFTSKIRTLPSRTGVLTSAGLVSGTSTLGFNIWPAQNSPMAYIRNEELILLRAEAELATGATAAAIADLNQVRVN